MWWFIRLVGALLTSSAAILLIVVPVIYDEIEPDQMSAVLYTLMAGLLWISLKINKPWQN